MPWSAENWRYLLGRGEVPPTPEEFEWNTRFRHLTVLFGDAAAAKGASLTQGLRMEIG